MSLIWIINLFSQTLGLRVVFFFFFHPLETVSLMYECGIPLQQNGYRLRVSKQCCYCECSSRNSSTRKLWYWFVYGKACKVISGVCHADTQSFFTASWKYDHADTHAFSNVKKHASCTHKHKQNDLSRVLRDQYVETLNERSRGWAKHFLEGAAVCAAFAPPLCLSALPSLTPLPCGSRNFLFYVLCTYLTLDLIDTTITSSHNKTNVAIFLNYRAILYFLVLACGAWRPADGSKRKEFIALWQHGRVS